MRPVAPTAESWPRWLGWSPGRFYGSNEAYASIRLPGCLPDTNVRSPARLRWSPVVRRGFVVVGGGQDFA